MKYLYLFTLFFCLIAFGAAQAVTNGGGSSRSDKGKGRAVDPPSPPPSPPPPSPPPIRPNTPTPQDHPSVPLPGRTGPHSDVHNKVATAHYGDDEYPQHTAHLQRNQAEFPHNRKPMSLASNPDQNRRNALHGIPRAPSEPGSNDRRARDEKMPAILHNPYHAKSTTVEYLNGHESDKEGSIMNRFKGAITALGSDARGQLRPNPGWHPLHPDQRRGHEAPARLNSPTFRPTGSVNPDMEAQERTQANRQKAASEEAKKTGYTPVAGDKILRHRKGQAPPPASASVPQRRRRPAGTNNLRPGGALPAGHVWKPSSDGSTTASHFGAPGHVKEADQWAPPRPQDLTDYRRRVQAQREEEMKYKRLALRKQKYLPAQSDNLRKFNEIFPVRHGAGSGRAHEAPGRMQTHVSHNAPPARPPLTRPPAPGRRSRSPTRQPPSKQHAGGSNPKSGRSKSRSKSPRRK